MELNLTPGQYREAWHKFDFRKIEKNLHEIQTRIYILAREKHQTELRHLQKAIRESLEYRALAVEKIRKRGGAAGIDHERWTDEADLMKAAIRLGAPGYQPSPVIQFRITDSFSGKERFPLVMTWFDSAMALLQRFTFLPVEEALADRYSFAFRLSRSMQDAHAWVTKSLNGTSAPKWVLCCDIKNYYHTILHSWILQHAPMDRGFLKKQLSAGRLFNGDLFCAEETGISEGWTLSTLLSNFILDGLEDFVYKQLDHEHKLSANGRVIRYADDFIIAFDRQRDAERILRSLDEFLKPRGLGLNPDKTRICHVTDGFDFVKRHYQKMGPSIISTPSETSVRKVKFELKEIVESHKSSQRDLIEKLNRKLLGFAHYQRQCDARQAFRDIDAYLQMLLLRDVKKKHPKTSLKNLRQRYWFETRDGRHVFALRHDVSCRVLSLSDIPLIIHSSVDVDKSPYIDTEYFKKRREQRDYLNIAGMGEAIFKLQKGRCAYCGQRILPDHEKEVLKINPRGWKTKAANYAYIHTTCKANELRLIETRGDPDYYLAEDTQYELTKLLEDEERGSLGTTIKHRITEKWTYYPLKVFFAGETKAHIKLGFKEIEEILGRPLPASAFKWKAWWYPSREANRIAEAWLTENFYLEEINLSKQFIKLRRDQMNYTHVTLPAYLESKIPDDASFEIETFLEHIRKKYRL